MRRRFVDSDAESSSSFSDLSTSVLNASGIGSRTSQRDEPSSQQQSSSSVDESSSDNASSLSDSSSSEEDVDLVQQLQEKVRAGIRAIVGTRESRFANRTNTSLKWKEDVAYAAAEAAYVAQKQADQDKLVAAHHERKLDRKRAKLAKKQDKANRKKDRLMAKKTAECNMKAAKLDCKMTILAQLRLERLTEVRAKSIHDELPWMSAQEAEFVDTLAAFTSKEAAKHVALADSLNFADEMGRKIGTLPAIRSPSRIQHPDQIETTTTLVLRLASAQVRVSGESTQENTSTTMERASKHKTLFTVNLKRFRHVEHCQGDKIGERGCVELGKSLLTGACPRLKELHLGWNGIKFPGVASLSAAFSRGGGSQLTFLDLRANSLDAKGVGTLFDAMANGGLPELETLILAGNMLGDLGGKAIAHAFLKGLFGTLRVLDIKSNGIRNDGCRAMFTAFTADCFNRLAPKLHLLDMRRNCINQVTADTFVPCPKHISF
ncbi:hypothetical protein DYB32_000670 [Aphanomyces invadans]|uniref:Uncharacterized protein n=1 Tax=Aphanomyces invadans TaxID=157072 RepID=A0A3R6WTH1_9STRA|nr:hypothetical protein DYB32_000670 [Aphanomyces invadans]